MAEPDAPPADGTHQVTSPGHGPDRTDPPGAGAPDLWAAVVGQPGAVELLRAAAGAPAHAYLFVGPPGTGRRAAARAFAAELFGDDPRTRRLVAAGRHPDLHEVERAGPRITAEQAREVVAAAVRSPVEAPRQVFVLGDMHLATDAAVVLLKTLEEPPAATVFVVIADDLTPELTTVASRCVPVRFRPLPPGLIAEVLISEGVEEALARSLSVVAGGSLGRARELAADPDAAARYDTWRAVPGRLDGRGATVATIVDELRSVIDDAAAPLRARQEAELAAATEEAERYGTRVPRRELTERHRREQRRLRTAELRAGLATLAAVYRDAAIAGAPVDEVAEALDRINRAAAHLEHNPVEELWLQALLISLPPLRGTRRLGTG